MLVTPRAGNPEKGWETIHYRLSARGAAHADEGCAAPPALGNVYSASQPFRAGLCLASGPPGLVLLCACEGLRFHATLLLMDG